MGVELLTLLVLLALLLPLPLVELTEPEDRDPDGIVHQLLSEWSETRRP